MSASRFAAIYDAILDTLNADPTLASVTITDSLPITDDRLDRLVMIGNGGNPEDTRSGSSRQQYHDLAGASSRRDETISIFCCVMAQTGDVDVSGTRTVAFGILASVEAALRGNYNLGLTDVLRVEVVDIEVYTEQFGDGTAIRLPFTIEATALI